MKFGEVLFYIKSLRFIPALLVTKRCPNAAVIAYEQERWAKCNQLNLTGVTAFLTLMMKFPEYRSLVYHRTGSNWLRHFGKGQTNLYFHTPSDRIGKGLVIWHGYSTVINADSIGEDCAIWHNVTIGKKTTLPVNDRPKIGDKVSVCTGSIVLGNIIIQNGTIIGAGSVVLDNIVNENSIVVGVKAKSKSLSTKS